jgi:hypothetical protein
MNWKKIIMSEPFDFLFRYFSFIASAVNLVNLWTVRDKVTATVKNYLASYSILFFLWGVLQIIGGYTSFFFVLLPPRKHPLVVLFWLIYFAWLWGSTIWVIWKGGAEELTKSSVARGSNRLTTPQSIKLFFAANSLFFFILVILGFTSGFFSKLVVDLPIF